MLTKGNEGLSEVTILKITSFRLATFSAYTMKWVQQSEDKIDPQKARRDTERSLQLVGRTLREISLENAPQKNYI